MKLNMLSHSEEETRRLGARLARVLEGGDILALDGDLGAGKTALTKGFCEEFKVTSHVASPTFNIVNEYAGGRLPVYHFDSYRLEGSDDFLDSGLDEYFDYGGISIIEWSSIIDDILPSYCIRLRINGSGNERTIEAVFDEDEIGEEKTSKLVSCFN